MTTKPRRKPNSETAIRKRLSDAIFNRFPPVAFQRYNLYALGHLLYGNGTKDIGTILRALEFLLAQPGTHPKPYAFIQSTGMLRVATTQAVDERVQAERVDSRGPTLIGDILRQAMERQRGTP